MRETLTTRRKDIFFRQLFRLAFDPRFLPTADKSTLRGHIVDGCFWHGHNCRNTKPQDNKVYWTNKIIRNKKRDRQVTKHFRDSDWIVIRLWECELKDRKKLDRKINISH
jgi:DNA mismatch endonuclease Vsr